MVMKDFVQNVQEYTARGQDWSYNQLNDSGSGASATLVQGQTGYKIKLVGFIISVDSAGKLEIKLNGTLAIHLEFDKRTSHIVYMPFPVLVSEGGDVEATFVADTAPANCYITTVYHLETI